MDMHLMSHRSWVAENAKMTVHTNLMFTERQLGFANQLLTYFNRRDIFEKFGNRIGLTVALAALAIDTANNITSMAVHGNIASAFMLARGLTEQTTNYAYLLVCDEKEFERWVKYSRQKAYKLLDRHEKAGKLALHLSVSQLPDPATIPGLEDDIAQFTGSKGGSVNRWSRLSLPKRLQVVEAKAAESHAIVVTLLGVLALVYDVGSEVLHGTLLGGGLRFGLLQPENQSREDHAATLLFVAGACLDVIVRMGGQAVGAQGLANASRASLEALLESARQEAAQQKSTPPGVSASD